MTMVEFDLEPTDNELRDIKARDGVLDTTQIYLQEIGKVSLLTAGEEVFLAKQIEKPKYLIPVLLDVAYADGDMNPLEAKRVIDILNQEAQIARRHLTEANLRLVVSISKKYLGKGMSFLDLIQEGNLGLMHAVEKYDWQKGYRFSTYATWWIRQAVTRAIADQARTIRLPVHMVEAISRVDTARRSLQQELQTDEPPIADIIEQLSGTFTPEKVNLVLRSSSVTASLDAPHGPDGTNSLGTMVVDEEQPDPAVTAFQHLLKAQVADVLLSLTGRERRLLQLRFGLDDGRARTLEEVGHILGVTRERIRQIEAKALKKLHHPSRAKKLRGLLG